MVDRERDEAVTQFSMVVVGAFGFLLVDDSWTCYP